MASKEGPGLVLKHLGETILEEERAKRDLRRRLEVVLLERGLSDDSFEISKPGQPVDFSAGGMGFRKVPLQSKILRSIQELQAYKSALSQTPGMEGYEAGLSATGRTYISPRRALKRGGGTGILEFSDDEISGMLNQTQNPIRQKAIEELRKSGYPETEENIQEIIRQLQEQGG